MGGSFADGEAEARYAGYTADDCTELHFNMTLECCTAISSSNDGVCKCWGDASSTVTAVGTVGLLTSFVYIYAANIAVGAAISWCRAASQASNPPSSTSPAPGAVQMAPTPVAQPVTQPVAHPVAAVVSQPMAQSVAQPVAQPVAVQQNAVAVPIAQPAVAQPQAVAVAPVVAHHQPPQQPQNFGQQAQGMAESVFGKNTTNQAVAAANAGKQKAREMMKGIKI